MYNSKHVYNQKEEALKHIIIETIESQNFNLPKNHYNFRSLFNKNIIDFTMKGILLVSLSTIAHLNFFIPFLGQFSQPSSDSSVSIIYTLLFIGTNVLLFLYFII